MFEYEDSRIILQKTEGVVLEQKPQIKRKQNEIAVPFPYKNETVKGISIYHMP